MDRKPPMSWLAGLGSVTEVARWLGWDRRKVSTYIRRGKLPTPLLRLAVGPIWHRDQFQEAGWIPVEEEGPES